MDIDTLRLLTHPDSARLTPKAAAVLLQLVRAEGRTMSRDGLLDEVWKGTCPTPDVLTQAVKDLRRALGDDLHAPRYVETVPRLGYRLVAKAHFVDGAELPDVANLPHVRQLAASADDRPTPDVANGRPRRYALPIAIVGVVALAALIALAAVFVQKESAQATTTKAQARWRAGERHAVTSDPGPEKLPQISPDGTRIAYVVGDIGSGHARIVLRSLAQSRVIRLSDTDSGDESYPAWSPDGASIAFTRNVGGECRMLVTPALGGSERLVRDCPNRTANYFSWSPDGKHLVTTAPSAKDANGRAIVLIPIDGGAVTPLAYEHDPDDIDLDPRYSPDGKSIAFRRGANPYSDLFIVDAGGRVRQLTRLASRIRGFDWTRDGTALVFSSSHNGLQSLYTVSIADGHIDALDIEPAESPSSARATDTVVYEIPRRRTQLAMVSLDGSGTPRELVPSTGSDGAPALSPVDGSLAFVSDRAGYQQLWLNDAKSNETFAVLGPVEPNLRYPVWEPDGAHVLITARGAAIGRLIEVDVATRTHRVVSSPDEDVRYGVSGAHPGSYIVEVADKVHGRKLIELDSPVGGTPSSRTLVEDVSRIDYDQATHIVYYTKVSQSGLFKLDPETGAEVLASRKINPAHIDGWLALNGEIYSIDPHGNGLNDIDVLDPATGDDRTLATFSAPLADLNFSVSRDGREAVVVRNAEEDTDVGAIALTREAGAH